MQIHCTTHVYIELYEKYNYVKKAPKGVTGKSWKEYLDAFKEKMSLAESGQAQKLTPSYYLKNVAPNRRLKNESTKEFYLDEKIQIEKRPDLIV